MALGNNRAAASFRSGKVIWLVVAVILAAVFAGSLTFLKNIYKTETYYVLNQPVAQRTQITPEMLTPVVTAAGSQPQSLGIADVQDGSVFARIPLQQGDVVTVSNTGGLDDISVGIPDSYVVTSIRVPADDASAGRIRRGVYFDMMVVDAEGAFYPFVNLLALDTTVSLNNASSSAAVDTDEARSGQTQLYYVGLSIKDSARLQHIMARYGSNVKLILSPRQNEYEKPDIQAYIGDGPNGIFRYKEGDTPVNGGEGTDNTFTPVKRDEFGRPIGTPECRTGNNAATAGQCDETSDSDTTGDTPESDSSSTTENELEE